MTDHVCSSRSTVAQLRAYLVANGIEFNRKAKKAMLLDLAKGGKEAVDEPLTFGLKSRVKPLTGPPPKPTAKVGELRAYLNANGIDRHMKSSDLTGTIKCLTYYESDRIVDDRSTVEELRQIIKENDIQVNVNSPCRADLVKAINDRGKKTTMETYMNMRDVLPTYNIDNMLNYLPKGETRTRCINEMTGVELLEYAEARRDFFYHVNRMWPMKTEELRRHVKRMKILKHRMNPMSKYVDTPTDEIDRIARDEHGFETKYDEPWRRRSVIERVLEPTQSPNWRQVTDAPEFRGRDGQYFWIVKIKYMMPYRNVGVITETGKKYVVQFKIPDFFPDQYDDPPNGRPDAKDGTEIFIHLDLWRRELTITRRRDYANDFTSVLKLNDPPDTVYKPYVSSYVIFLFNYDVVAETSVPKTTLEYLCAKKIVDDQMTTVRFPPGLRSNMYEKYGALHRFK